MFNIYWKKDLGGIAVGYLILALIWPGIWAITYSYAGNFSGFIEIMSYLFASDPFFITYQFCSTFLSIAIFCLIFFGREITYDKLKLIITFSIIIVVIDIIPIILRILPLLSGGKAEVPFTIFLIIFHTVLLIQIWWYSRKGIPLNS